MRRRLIIAPFILLAITIPTYMFFGVSLAEGNKLVWLLWLIPFLFLVSMPISWLMRHREKKSSLASLYMWFVHFFMGFISFALVFVILYDAAEYIFHRHFSTILVYGATALTLVVGMIWAATGPRKKVIRLKIPHLPVALDGFRIVQISDLHIGETIRKPYVKRTVAMANACEPNLIAMTGDIGDGNVRDLQDTVDELKQLSAPHGVFYVPGNHEYYWNLADWQKAIADTGSVTLLNDGRLIDAGNGKIYVGGIADPAAGQVGSGAAPDVPASLRGSDGATFKILLSHRPDFAEEAAGLGYNLQLSGHTHGGQFFPWTIAVKFVHHLAVGAYQVKDMWAYVSAGTGSWGPLLRLGTTPEVSCIVLERYEPSRARQ